MHVAVVLDRGEVQTMFWGNTYHEAGTQAALWIARYVIDAENKTHNVNPDTKRIVKAAIDYIRDPNDETEEAFEDVSGCVWFTVEEPEHVLVTTDDLEEFLA